MEQALLFFDFSKNIEQDVYQKASSACPRQICSCSVNIADECIMTGSLSVSFSFLRYYGGVIKQYRFLQVFIGNMMVLQIFCIKIKHDIFPLYKPLIFCVKIN